MRTTLDLADDVLQVAKERARRERKTIGEIISGLARSALNSHATPTVLQAQQPLAVYGFQPFPKRGNIVTNDTIDKLREGDAY